MGKTKDRPVILSGQQPTGELTIGNLIGALRNWVALQDEYDSLFTVVDLHAITVLQEPKELRRRTLDVMCLYIASGIDPEKCTVFVQSHVPAHAELAWILGCYTYMGELGRMTQFKEKAKKQGENIRTGLFTYPTLMAADILIYDADLVPVGDDQRQHLEITRDIAQRFNNAYGETFTVPEAYIPPVGARIMSLIDPTAKMSKTDENPKSYVALLDPPDVARSKVKKAMTDSGTDVRYSPEERPAISNLMTIRSVLTGESTGEIEDAYAGKGYAPFKEDLAEVVIETLRPIQERYEELRADKKEVERIMAGGAAAAERRARRILDKVKRKVGFIARPR
jgi:tryptophanyl-tRNA synthetase